MTSTQGPIGASAQLSTAAGTWVLDPAASTIHLHTKAMWGMAKVKVAFVPERGTATVTPDGGVTGQLVIDVHSLDSGNKKRDTHLKTADFLEAEQYPTITFDATGATPGAAGTYLVDGTLKVRDTVRPLQVPVTIDDLGSTSVTLTGEVDMDRSDWGVSLAKFGARVHNHIVITARFTKA